MGGSLSATWWEVHWTLSFRGRKSRNKVFVSEPAEGSLSIPQTTSSTRHCKIELILKSISIKSFW